MKEEAYLTGQWFPHFSSLFEQSKLIWCETNSTSIHVNHQGLSLELH